MRELIIDFGRGRQPWKRLPLFLSMVLAASFLNSCGNSSTSTTTSTPSVTVTCNALGGMVTLGGTTTCTATVLNETSTLANWSISPAGTGSFTTGGTNSSTATYKAPATFPGNSMNVVTITAASVVASTVTGTAMITIEQPTVINAVTCLDPNNNNQPSSTVSSGNQLVCSAVDSTGADVPGVNWTVSNALNPSGNNGTISLGGTYTAPLVPPTGQAIMITATSQTDSTNSKNLTVTVVFGNKVLSGPYAFSTSGRTPTNAFWARVGSFTAGQDGTLTGFEDTNQGGTPNIVNNTSNNTTPPSPRTFTGSFSIGPDGRGTMQFCEGSNSACPQTSQASAYFRIVVISPQQAQIIEFSKPGLTSATLTAGGEMISQDPSVFNSSNLPLPLNGVYSFNFSGVSTSATEESAVGEFKADGFGHISQGSAAPPLAPGEIDIDANGAQALGSSTYLYSSNGRGTVTLNGLLFSFYMISAGRAKFIEIDAPAPPATTPDSILTGDAYIQQTSLTCEWGASTLSNSIVFETSGASSGVQIADVGNFTATSVNTTNGNVTAASIDENSGGTVSSQVGTLSGTYTMDPCGRGTLAIGSHSYVFYIISASNAVLQEITPGVVAHGFLLPLLPPQGGSFVDGTLTGSYAFRLAGTDAAGAGGNREDFLGQFTSTGSGTGLTGDLDLNDFDVTQTGCVPLTMNCVAIMNGMYSPAPVGSLRGTISLPLTTAPNPTTRNLVLYLVSPTLFYALDTDTTGTAVGVIYNQF